MLIPDPDRSSICNGLGVEFIFCMQERARKCVFPKIGSKKASARIRQQKCANKGKHVVLQLGDATDTVVGPYSMLASRFQSSLQ